MFSNILDLILDFISKFFNNRAQESDQSIFFLIFEFKFDLISLSTSECKRVIAFEY